jgi:hypothetical protein
MKIHMCLEETEHLWGLFIVVGGPRKEGKKVGSLNGKHRSLLFLLFSLPTSILNILSRELKIRTVLWGG